LGGFGLPGLNQTTFIQWLKCFSIEKKKPLWVVLIWLDFISRGGVADVRVVPQETKSLDSDSWFAVVFVFV